MRLQPQQTVYDVHPFALESPSPFDVALFVETGFQLHQDSDFLAVARRLEQGRHHGRVLAHPVERLLDGQHVWVAGGGLEQVHHGFERFEGMMQEDILLPDSGEHVQAVDSAQALRLEGNEGRILEIWPVAVVEAAEGAHGQRQRHLVEVIGSYLQIAREDGPDVAWHGGIDHQPHHRAEASAAHKVLHGLQQVGCFQLLDGDVRIPGDPEEVGLHDLHSREQLGEVSSDHLFQPDEVALLGVLGIRH